MMLKIVAVKSSYYGRSPKCLFEIENSPSLPAAQAWTRVIQNKIVIATTVMITVVLVTTHITTTVTAVITVLEAVASSTV